MSSHPLLLENCRACSTYLGSRKFFLYLKKHLSSLHSFSLYLVLLLFVFYYAVTNMILNVVICFSLHCLFLPLITEAHKDPAHLCNTADNKFMPNENKIIIMPAPNPFLPALDGWPSPAQFPFPSIAVSLDL